MRLSHLCLNLAWRRLYPLKDLLALDSQALWKDINCLQNIESLDVSFNEIGEKGFNTLITSSNLPALVELDLDGNEIAEDSFELIRIQG